VKPLTLADTTSSVDGAAGLTATVPATGAVLATVTLWVTVSLAADAGSVAKTSTWIVSPRSPLPARERSSVALVSPLIAVPLRSQRKW
jgi:hypothetical protein